MTEALWQLGGWTMLHFLWVGTIAALLGGLVRLICRRAAPAVRYALSLATLAVLAALPVAIAAWLALHRPTILAGRAEPLTTTPHTPLRTPSQDGSAIYAAAEPRVIDLATTPPPVLDEPAEALSQPQHTGSPDRIANPSPSPSLRGRGIGASDFVPYLPYAWLVGTPLTFALLATGLIGSERLRRRSTLLVAGPAFEACEQLRMAMRIARRVSVAACEGLAQPVLVGVVRPLILLPASALSGWTPEELEMVLVHELAHVRRWDNLVNLLQRIAESLLFFHPAVWLVSRQVRRDREECCDAVVVSRTAQPQRYAELLVSIAAVLPRGQAPRLAAASAMADHPLAGRIRRILKLEDEPMWVSRRTLLLALVLPGLVALGLLNAGLAAGSADAEEPTTKSREIDATPKPAASTKDNVADAAEQAQEAEPDWDDPTVLKRLFSESQTNPLEKLVYEVSTVNEYPGQLTDLFEGVQRDPYGPQVEFEWRWIENDKRIEITAPKEAHGWFRKVLTGLEAAAQQNKAQEAPQENGPNLESPVDHIDPAIEIPRVQSEIRRLRDLINEEKRNLANVEVFKQLALHNAGSPQELEKAIEAALNVDSKVVQDQHLITSLKSAIERLRRDGRGPVIELLEKELEAAEREAEAYREKRRAEIRQQLARMPNDALRAAIVEYKIRHKAATENLQKYEQELNEAERKLAEMEELDGQRMEQEPLQTDLQPGDEVKIEVLGAFPAAPIDRVIDGVFVIEPQGTVALGALHGRVEIAGMSLIEAEKAVTEKLEAVLSDPQVQITLPPSRFRREDAVNDGPPSRPTESAPYALGIESDPAPEPAEIILMQGAVSQRGRTTAYLRVKLRPRTDRGTPQELERMHMNHLALVKSDRVIERALMRDDVVGLKSVRRENPEAWLQRRLKASFPQDGEILELVLPAEEGVPEAEDGILLDAVVEAYMNHARFAAEQATANNEASEASRKSENRETTYLYDGKTFEEWRSLWKNELNPIRRAEAISAMAAFSRTGYGKEATVAILDVADQYDFNSYDQSPEGQLKQRVLDVLTNATSRVSEANWLPELMERLRADRDKWTPLTGMLLSQLHQANPGGVRDAGARKLLFELASDPKFKWWHEALRVLLLGGDDVPLTPEVERFVKEALTGKDKDRAIHVLVSLNFQRLDAVPEQIDLLFDEEVRRAARGILPNLSAAARSKLAERLLAVLDDAERSRHHADAVRALGVLLDEYNQFQEGLTKPNWERSKEFSQITDRLFKLIREGPEEIVPTALVAMGLDSVERVDEWLKGTGPSQPEDVQERVMRARDKIDAEAKRVMDDARNRGMGGGFF